VDLRYDASDAENDEIVNLPISLALNDLASFSQDENPNSFDGESDDTMP
jgi:hypothetical protein